MHKFTRFVNLLIAVMMVLAMSVLTFAVDDDSYSITIKQDIDGYEYTVYQIFDGDLYINDDGDVILSNIVWGEGISSDNTSLQALLTNTYGTTNAKTIATKITTTAEAEAFAKLVGPYLATGYTANYVAGTGYKVTKLDAGYYLVKNTSIPNTDGSYTYYIMEVLDDVEAEPKTYIPSSDKVVFDSDGDEQEAVNYSIGDTVPFEISATLPENYALYENYQITFHDKMDDGLTFDNTSVKMTITTTNGEYTVDDSCYDLDQSNTSYTFEISIDDVHDLTSSSLPLNTYIDKDSVITVYYEAELNTDAVIGGTGNLNTMNTTYSSDPNWHSATSAEEEPISNTPEESVVVYTYELDINKVVENDEGSYDGLVGAGFTLYKEDDSGEYQKVGDEVLKTDSYAFVWEGLGDGNYKLVETTTPKGYNTMEDIYFTVESEVSEDEGIKNLTIKNSDGDTISVTTDDIATNPTYTTSTTTAFATKATAGVLATSIVNYAGSVLPSTGGMGTTIFYVVGGAMVIFAVVMLIARKRNGSAEE